MSYKSIDSESVSLVSELESENNRSVQGSNWRRWDGGGGKEEVEG